MIACPGCADVANPRRCHMQSQTNRRPSTMRARCKHRVTAAFTVLVATAYPIAAEAKCNDHPASGVDWSQCEKMRLMLGGSDLSGGTFEETSLPATDLSGANLSGARLVRAELTRASLAGANLEMAD